MVINNRHYGLVMASDVHRGGMYLELYEEFGTPMIMSAFYSDADGTFEYEQFCDGIPLDIMEWFRGEALKRLPPIAE